MQADQFQKIVEHRIESIRATLTAKADEYARGDRLSNFKQAALLTHKHPLEVLAGLVVKHEIAFHDFVRDWAVEGHVQSYARWEEKLGDIINYMILADALIQEYLPGPKDASIIGGSHECG